MEIKHDPIEDDLAYRDLLDAVDAEVEAELAAMGYKRGRMFGYCHAFWGLKKERLKEQHSIDWQSPAELNPGVCFD